MTRKQQEQVTNERIRSFAKSRKPNSMSVKRHALLLHASLQGENQTPIEESVEQVLHEMELYGRSQVPIGESYIVDFILKDGVTVIEYDGAAYHQDPNHERDQFLIGKGFRVLHLSGKACMNQDFARREIQNFIDDYVDDKCSLIRYVSIR